MRYLSIRALRPSRWSMWFLLAVLTSTGCLYVGWDDMPNANVRPAESSTWKNDCPYHRIVSAFAFGS